MNENKEKTPEIRREKMRQKELESPSSSIHGSNLADLVGGLNWKIFGMLILVIIIGGGYFLLKYNPPLETGTIAASEDNKSVVIGIGNNGFREIQILDVSVNNDEEPLKTNLQVSNMVEGFIKTDYYNSEEASEFDFANIDEVVIKAGTLSDTNIINNGGIYSKDDEIYGVSIIHNEEINNVTIEYSHFGMTFRDSVVIDNS